ncbi:MAG: aconitate hydratase AcnA [Proteobacteria bacterium]|nr:aconitate hydratase AcnA [Pseudomonadota bacterium]NCA28195.1 aconitate hydratase AcnA [Pseudomonadota bacterium]
MNLSNQKAQLKVGDKNYKYFSIIDICQEYGLNIDKLPFSLKILIENLVRTYTDKAILRKHITAIANSIKDPANRIEIAFSPARVLMQDFTGVPAVVDLATMRDAVKKIGKDPKKINPLVPVDLVIDHSVQVDFYGNKNAYTQNVELEYERNRERYEFLKWAQKSFNNFRVVPPGTGICHQVNLENLAQVIWTKKSETDNIAYFDTVVGTDSHTTMINGLAVLGWGVGGIEAEAAMLGQPISMLIPEVIGFKLSGKLSKGVTATDLVLTITQILRKKGVVGKFVEFFGDGIASLSLANRATIANMAPEYGATCGIFPIDKITLDYLHLTGRDQDTIDLVEAYAKAQKVFVDSFNNETEFSDIIELNLAEVVPSLAGPKRPQDKVVLEKVNESFENLQKELKIDNKKRHQIESLGNDIGDGDIVIGAITSCTNTSNPSVLIGAGLLAKKAVELGLKVNPRVKTSLAPGSQVVSDYLAKSGLQNYLDQLGFNIVGYGCTTCIGNSGPLKNEIEETIKNNNLVVASVLSGNRNFEGRIHPLVKANYLASPLLVVAYSIAGTVKINLDKDPIGVDKNGNKVYLKDIWPVESEIESLVKQYISREVFSQKYANLFAGDEIWQKIQVSKSDTYDWNPSSTYIRLPNYFDNLNNIKISPVKNAKILAIFGDSITTDHISPAGNISPTSPAGLYLNQNGVVKKDFNSYGARRGNHEVMIRGTFANIRIKNEMLGGLKEGGFTKNINNEIVSIYDASVAYQNRHPLVIFAGKEYGTGSSRDWAAKGTYLLGVKAVIAESFERIHRSNLIGMGVLPLIFKDNQSRKTLNLNGDEVIDIIDIDDKIIPKQNIRCVIHKSDGSKTELDLICGLDTSNEVEYFKSGGILQFVINQIIN